MRATNYDKFLNMSLRCSGLGVPAITQDMTIDPMECIFIDVLAEKGFAKPDSISVRLDTYLACMCMHVKSERIPEMLYHLGLVAEQYGYYLEIGMQLSWRLCVQLQKLSMQYFSERHNEHILFTNYLAGNGFPYLYFCMASEDYIQLYDVLVQPEVAGIYYLMRKHSLSGDLCFPSILKDMKTDSIFNCNQYSLCAYFAEHVQCVPNFEVLQKMVTLLSALDHDPCVANKIWKYLCIERMAPEDMHADAIDAIDWMQDSGIIETRM